MCHLGINTFYLWVRYCPLVPGSTLITVDEQPMPINHLVYINILCLGGEKKRKG